MEHVPRLRKLSEVPIELKFNERKEVQTEITWVSDMLNADGFYLDVKKFFSTSQKICNCE